MPAEARAVHGLSDEFLAKQRLFAEIASDFLAFIADSPLVIHNAEFDIGFLNAELVRAKLPALPGERAVDTVALARRKFPGAPANLDALCRRFGIDNSDRRLHGALLDASLLAEVYLELTGGRQAGLGFVAAEAATAPAPREGGAPTPRRPRPHAPSATEIAAHEQLVAKLKNPIWNR
jgi:DNA polymerase-3 subunit epsilon